MTAQDKPIDTGAVIYFEFIKNRFIFYAISACILFGTPTLLFFRGLNLGLDFVGGYEAHYRFPQHVTEDEIRKALKDENLKAMEDVVVQKIVQNPVPGQPVAAGDEYMLRTKALLQAEKNLDEKLERALERIGKGKPERRSINKIGPVVGDMLKKKTYQAILLSVVVILLYMSYRFEFKPGVTCAISLIHDTCTVLLLFCITQYEVDLNVVAAILTVLGYSMNDSIVILDRFRENQRIKRKIPFDELMNLSVNECLSRTIFTGLTVVMTLLSLYFLGPEILKNFSLALTIGVISGAFSTVSVVTPLYVDWQMWAERKVRASRGG